MSEANTKRAAPINSAVPAADLPVFVHLYDAEERASVLEKLTSALQASLTFYRGRAVGANAILKTIDNDYGINGELEARKLGFSTFDALLQTSDFAAVLEVVWPTTWTNKAYFPNYKLKAAKDIEHIVGSKPGAAWLPDSRRPAKLAENRQRSRSRHAPGGRQVCSVGTTNARGMPKGGTSDAPANLDASGQPKCKETRDGHVDISKAAPEGQQIEGCHRTPQCEEPTNSDGDHEEEGEDHVQSHANPRSVVAKVRPSSAPGVLSVSSLFVLPTKNPVDDICELPEAVAALAMGGYDEEEEEYATPPSELCDLRENDADDEKVEELSEGEWDTMTELDAESDLVTDSEIAMTVELDVAPDSTRSSPESSARPGQPCSATPVPTNEFHEPLMCLTYAVYMVVSQRYTIKITELTDCISLMFGRDVQPMSEYGTAMQWPQFIESYCQPLGVICAQIRGETVCCLRDSPAKGYEAVKAAMAPYLQYSANAEEW
ncbi:hypothetical protein AAVH_06663 [Aphelenchoides avenae]|nr:hypothetical protein AAVH_06663 [Aphelenchus avenae]